MRNWDGQKLNFWNRGSIKVLQTSRWNEEQKSEVKQIATKVRQIHFILSVAILIVYKTQYYCKKYIDFPKLICFLFFYQLNLKSFLILYSLSKFFLYVRLAFFTRNAAYFLEHFECSEFNPTENVAISCMHTAKKVCQKT